MKVAIVHDWLTTQGGAERVVGALHQAFPDAPIYTSLYNADKLPQFKDADIRTSFLQKIPFANRKHQLFPTLRPMAFEAFDLSEYDVVFSSCSAEAKGVITRPETLHICYLYTPTRYYWSNYQEYLHNTGFGILSPIVRLFMPGSAKKMREWDFAAAQRVDQYLTQSHYVAKRIEKYYRRNDTPVINPPIVASRFKISDQPKKGYLVVSRLIPYKRVDLAVLACTELNLPLTVIGDGSELASLKAMAGPTITFTGYLSDEKIAEAYANAEALIFTPEEDFGLTPLESMASGRPVIAFAKGGATETVIEGKTGTLFNEQTVESLTTALKNFDASKYDPKALRTYAKTYDEAEFIKKIKKFVDDRYKEYKKQ